MVWMLLPLCLLSNPYMSFLVPSQLPFQGSVLWFCFPFASMIHPSWNIFELHTLNIHYQLSRCVIHYYSHIFLLLNVLVSFCFPHFSYPSSIVISSNYYNIFIFNMVSLACITLCSSMIFSLLPHPSLIQLSVRHVLCTDWTNREVKYTLVWNLCLLETPLFSQILS